jgi:hypothetical protein
VFKNRIRLLSLLKPQQKQANKRHNYNQRHNQRNQKEINMTKRRRASSQRRKLVDNTIPQQQKQQQKQQEEATTTTTTRQVDMATTSSSLQQEGNVSTTKMVTVANEPELNNNSNASSNSINHNGGVIVEKTLAINEQEVKTECNNNNNNTNNEPQTNGRDSYAIPSYEEERLKKIQRNRERLAALGLGKQRIGGFGPSAVTWSNTFMNQNNQMMNNPFITTPKRTHKKKEQKNTPKMIRTPQRSSERLRNKYGASYASPMNETSEIETNGTTEEGAGLSAEQEEERRLVRKRVKREDGYAQFMKPKRERLAFDEPAVIEWQGQKYVTRRGLSTLTGADTRNTTHPLKFDRYKALRNVKEDPFIVIDVSHIDDLQLQYPGITVWHFKHNIMRLYTTDYAQFLAEYYGHGCKLQI